MRFNRRPRVVTALIALFSVLFMQLAVAAYACPTMTPTPEIAVNDGWSSADAHSEMDGCEGSIDHEEAALCFAYSAEGSQSLYKPPVPDIQPPAVALVVREIVDATLAYSPAFPRAQAPWLMRASAPPLSIRNCCFRI